MKTYEHYWQYACGKDWGVKRDEAPFGIALIFYCKKCLKVKRVVI